MQNNQQVEKPIVHGYGTKAEPLSIEQARAKVREDFLKLAEIVMSRVSLPPGHGYRNTRAFGLESQLRWAGCEVEDPDGFAIVGDDAGLLILEAQAQLIDPTVAQGQPQAKNPDAFNYQLLGRLKQDCDYYLGNGGRAKKHLWAGDVPAQIAKMNELFAGFSEKPQWISLEDICSYEAQMSNATVLTPSMTSGNTAYEATVEDVENVLRSNSLAVANTHGMSFESLAEKLHGDLDFGLIEQAALAGDELDEQTGYANDEIARQLREKGVLESSKMVDGDVHPSAFEIKQSFSDGEVICKDNDGALIQSDATNKESYNSGQSAAEFGMDNLSEIEVQRLNMKG